MFERFTSPARSVVVEAQNQAAGRNGMGVGTEHLLLAMLDMPRTLASQALRELGQDWDQVRRTIDEVAGDATAFTGQRGDVLPFGPLAKQALSMSLRRAMDQGHNTIRSTHLLEGMMAVPNCAAAEVLRRLVINEAALRDTVAELDEQAERPDLARVLGPRQGDSIAVGPFRRAASLAQPAPRRPPWVSCERAALTCDGMLSGTVSPLLWCFARYRS
jgi:ATP-dependent Clp protease ATP-binding subunit ClpA